MIVHDVKQGSEAWRKLRADHDTASEAAAMLGLSKYQSRNDLLKQKATGIVEEVTPAKQKLFDDGHAAEAKARPITETLIGTELFPCTATDDEGQYLASFDGIDMMESVIWEHKINNKALMDAINQGEVPDTHWPQLEQQLLVSGADKAMFMCSDGTTDNMAYIWYTSVPERRQQIIDGWTQFNKDLANYEHREYAAAPVGKTPDALPSLHIEVKGMVTASNLDEFKETAMAVIGGIKTELKTDNDFADAKKTVKWLKGVEDKLDVVIESVLSQTSDIDTIFKTIGSVKEEARAARLNLGRQVKTQEDNIKAKVVLDAKEKFSEFVEGINNLLEYGLPHINTDFAGVIKNKRTRESLDNAVDTELARAMIEANNYADKIRSSCALIDSLAADYRFLFADAEHLVLKDEDDLKAVIASRIAAHKEQEAQRKADKEAAEARRLEQEVKLKADKERAEEKHRLAQEAQEKEENKPVFAEDLATSPQKLEPEQSSGQITPDFDVDIVLRRTAGMGYLPIIISNESQELYRGEYHRTAALALENAELFLELESVA